ncbi:ferritin family protein [Candidatus Bipolaricaulota bacterium]|nr:ferritin family protein [Candidatus Bipolaricaulota bacterium]
MSEEKESGALGIPNDESSLKQLLEKAIKSEIESAETYRNLLKKDLPDETRTNIEKLVTQEEGHEENFRSIFEDFFPDEEISLPERSEIEVLSEIPRNATPSETIEQAMKTERESEDFYSNLIEEFDDREIRRLLGFLAANEREHYEILKVELNKLE